MMSDKKISDLVELTTLAADDVLPVVDADANATKRITGANLSKFPTGVTVPDGGTIGSASDTDAITIDATGNVALSQALQLGDGTAISSLGADSFRVTSDVTSNGIITSWEPVDEATSARLGSNVTESSGVFNVPNDGIWLVHFFAELNTNVTNDNLAGIKLFINGNETIKSDHRHTNQGGGAGTYIGGTANGLFIGNLTPSDDVDLRASDFEAFTFAGGSTSISRTAITFVRLGDA